MNVLNPKTALSFHPFLPPPPSAPVVWPTPAADGHTQLAMATPTQPNPTLDGETNAFRITAYIEAVTWLILLGAVFVKRVLDGSDFVRVLGPIHGVTFLVYLVLVLKIRGRQAWGLGQTLLVIIATVLPLGGFWAGRHLK